MLSSLQVRNLVLVESAAINLAPGLVAFTGETGAGKSLLMGSLNLAAGERASADLIGKSAEDATVSANFVGANQSFDVRRVVRSNGQSRVLIDGEKSTLAELKILVEPQIHLVEQGDVRNLLEPTTQLAQLDSWVLDKSLFQRVADQFDRLQAAQKQLRELRAQEKDRQFRLDYIADRLADIEHCAMTQDDYDENRARAARARHAATVVELTELGLANLQESEESAVDLIGRFQTRADDIAEEVPEFAAIGAQLDIATEAINESVRVLQGLRSFDAQDVDVDEIESELAAVEAYAQKYNVAIDSQLEHVQDLRTEAQSLQQFDASVAQLESDVEREEDAYRVVAQLLRDARVQASVQLTCAAVPLLHQLALQDAQLEYQFLDAAPQANGFDEVQLLFAGNVGMEPRPIQKVASGGELSRVLLAVLSAAAAHETPKTFIFDEIDAGVGGETAHAVADTLKLMAEKHQVVVITHLPQVAAAARQHFALYKATIDGRVVTNVNELSEDGRTRELARMLGASDNEASISLAEQLRKRYL